MNRSSSSSRSSGATIAIMINSTSVLFLLTAMTRNFLFVLYSPSIVLSYSPSILCGLFFVECLFVK